MFDENLYVEISSEQYSETLISDLSPSFNVPEGDYQISIYSDNLYPACILLPLFI